MVATRFPSLVPGRHNRIAAQQRLPLSGRDDALVVVDYRDQSVGLITLAWLALIKVRTYKLYAMVVHVVVECPDGVTRCPAIIGVIGSLGGKPKPGGAQAVRMGLGTKPVQPLFPSVVSVTPGEMSVSPEPTSAVDGIALGLEGDAQTANPPSTTNNAQA